MKHMKAFAVAVAAAVFVYAPVPAAQGGRVFVFACDGRHLSCSVARGVVQGNQAPSVFRQMERHAGVR